MNQSSTLKVCTLDMHNINHLENRVGFLFVQVWIECNAEYLRTGFLVSNINVNHRLGARLSLNLIMDC